MRKLHAEINQLINQVTLLNVAAIAVFGAIASAVFYKSTPNQTTGTGVISSETLLASISLLTLLLTLFLVGYAYFRTVRFISAYLIVTNSSHWEQHYWALNNPNRGGLYFLYSESRVILFLVLGCFAAGLPWWMHLQTNHKFESQLLAYALMILFLIYTVTIIWLGFKKSNHTDMRMMEKWRLLFNNHDFSSSLEASSSDKNA